MASCGRVPPAHSTHPSEPAPGAPLPGLAGMCAGAARLKQRVLTQVDSAVIDDLREPYYAARPRGQGCNSSEAYQTAAAVFAQHSSPDVGGDGGGMLADLWRSIPEPLQHLLGSRTAEASLIMRRHRDLLAQDRQPSAVAPEGRPPQPPSRAGGSLHWGSRSDAVAGQMRRDAITAAALPRVPCASAELGDAGSGTSSGSGSWPDAVGAGPGSRARSRALKDAKMKPEGTDGQLKDQSLVIRNAWEGESKLLQDPYADDQLPAAAVAMLAQYQALGHACPLFARKFAAPTSRRLAEVARLHILR